jgi:2-polyprenyl-6-hydroxyphenyl methylase/3-demethylubiquinone-9 3-methyltransferase
MTQPAKNTICLWYDGDAEEAARFYAKTFPNSSVGAVHTAPGDYPSGKKGDVLTVEFTVMGIPCLGLNGGPEFKHNEAFSFQVATEDQAETDRYWNTIVGNGGEESECGWCKDKWGVSWQITPVALTRAYTDPDRAAAKRAFDAMMHMKKIDIATIEAAHSRNTNLASSPCPTVAALHCMSKMIRKFPNDNLGGVPCMSSKFSLEWCCSVAWA